MLHYAHSGTQDDRSDWQLLGEHLAGVAELASANAAPIGLSACAAVLGRFHDLGKYDPEFDRRLMGENIRIDHSTAGGSVILAEAEKGMQPLAEALAYAILGHHAGLPDKTGETDACMDRRLARPLAPLDPEWRAHLPVDFRAIGTEVMRLIRRGPKQGFDLSVAVRMMFSCLVDADYRDTQAFYDRLEGRQSDATWPKLADVLPTLRARFDKHMSGFAADSGLNKLRAQILTHVRDRAEMSPGAFTLCVPTGGGKTLASLGFALDHAARHGHRRIIYAIPYTSIIDQTAAIFRDLLGDDIVLEHHSALDAENSGAEARDKLKLAMEDWVAPVVVTTNVQLFESLFAARPSRCRKLHNIAGSVIVLDEAQCLPRCLLMPTLAMIDTLTHHYGCSVILCTATQPAFDSRELENGGLPLENRELAPDPDQLARDLRRVTIRTGAVMDDEALVSGLADTPQGVVIVNSRKHALDLFDAARAAGLDGVIHLTTRQYAVHRRQIIGDIRERLKTGQTCRLISTSLIEAGVDLDFPVGWRAEAGLDSVIQAAGRVNREGRLPVEQSILTVFHAPDNPPPAEVARLAEAMRRTAARFDDLLSPAAINDWFNEVYWTQGTERMGEKLVKAMILTGSSTDFRFRTLAEEYRMIDSRMVPVIIPGDDAAQEAIRQLEIEVIGSGGLARRLQPYTVQIPQKARDLLRTNGKGDFASRDARGDQFFVLKDLSLYHQDIGLWWEQADYLAHDQLTI
jgi:CRISPR-associated endonuclease/helicase Cas3